MPTLLGAVRDLLIKKEEEFWILMGSKQLPLARVNALPDANLEYLLYFSTTLWVSDLTRFNKAICL